MIQLLSDFRGYMTHERLIPAGLYAEDDPLLYGQASFLLKHGFAVRVDTPSQVVPEPEQPESEAEAVEPNIVTSESVNPPRRKHR